MTGRTKTKISAVAMSLMLAAGAVAAQNPVSIKVYPGTDGRLIYVADEQGDTIPDYSLCGYEGGGVRLPDVPVKQILEPSGSRDDDTARIQAAINQLAGTAPDSDGFRGTLLLKKGIYRIAGTLRIDRDGIVLRGEGNGRDGTILFASGQSERSLIQVGSDSKACSEISRSRVKIVDPVVPVGSHTLSLSSSEGYTNDDLITVLRCPNEAWIHEIGMDNIPKRPGKPEETKNWTAEQYQIGYLRRITAIEGNRIEIDAPIVCAIDERWGGGDVFRCQDSRVRNCGVENLRIISEFNPSVVASGHYSDEQKCKTAVEFDGIKGGWLRDVISVHLDQLVLLGRPSQWITVQDCAYLDPVSIVTGGRRYAFKLAGQQCLIQRCYAEAARHAFVFESRTPGPNTILDCLAVQNLNTSEPHHRWSTGGLYDNFSGDLSIINRAWRGSGHGWTAGAFTAWNTEGRLVVQHPPTAMNYAIGHVGEKSDALLKDLPDGWWESQGKHVEPRSLYLAQLNDRRGENAVIAITTESQRCGTIYDDLKKRFSTSRDKVWGAGMTPEMEEYQ